MREANVGQAAILYPDLVLQPKALEEGAGQTFVKLASRADQPFEQEGGGEYGADLFAQGGTVGVGQRMPRQPHLAAGRRAQAGHYRHQCRLAAPIAADDEDDLAPADRQIDRAEPETGIAIGRRMLKDHVRQFDQRRAGGHRQDSHVGGRVILAAMAFQPQRLHPCQRDIARQQDRQGADQIVERHAQEHQHQHERSDAGGRQAQHRPRNEDARHHAQYDQGGPAEAERPIAVGAGFGDPCMVGGGDNVLMVEDLPAPSVQRQFVPAFHRATISRHEAVVGRAHLHHQAAHLQNPAIGNGHSQPDQARAERE